MADEIKKYISKVTLPNGEDYFIKDTEARDMIAALQGVSFYKCTGDTISGKSYNDVPYDVSCTIGGSSVTGSLKAIDATKSNVYLVPASHIGANDIYDEYIPVCINTQSPSLEASWIWEKIGDTEINFEALGDLAYHDNVTFSKGSGDNVLGEDTSFTVPAHTVTINTSTDTFVKSYDVSTSKLATTSIVGVDGTETFDIVASHTDYTVNNITFGTDVSASYIETESKTATNTVFGSDVSVSYVTVDASAAYTVAKAAGSATSVSYISDITYNGSNEGTIVASMSVDNETLTFYLGTVRKSSITGTNGTETITAYKVSQKTAPQLTSNDTVNVSSVKTNTGIAVPVISSQANVTTTKITTASKTVAKKAASATTVATGSLNASDSSGADVAVGLKNKTTGTALKSITSTSVAAQTVTVGEDDLVKVAKYNDLGVTVTDNSSGS